MNKYLQDFKDSIGKAWPIDKAKMKFVLDRFIAMFWLPPSKIIRVSALFIAVLMIVLSQIVSYYLGLRDSYLEVSCYIAASITLLVILVISSIKYYGSDNPPDGSVFKTEESKD